MGSKIRNLWAILIAVLFFFSSVYFSGVALRGIRADLTEEDLYTLADGTRSILGDIDEPITLRLFYSKELAAEIGMDNFGRRVTELLDEFRRAADGKLHVEVIEPEQYSEEEELATSFGLRGQMVSNQGDLFFFGLAATNSVDDLETLPNLHPNQESFLEYELAKMISKLSSADPQKIALISGLPLTGGPSQNPFGPPPEAWPIIDVLRDTFELSDLGTDLTGPIADDVDMLLVVHPKGLSETTRYAIDQYALAGGKICALVDPHCFNDLPPPTHQRGMPWPNASQLEDLLSTWGVTLTPETVVGDLSMAQAIRDPQGLIPFPLWMEMNEHKAEGIFHADDVVTASMKLVTFLTPGELNPAEEATTTFTPLIQTTSGGRTLDAQQFQFDPNIVGAARRIYPSFLLHAEGSIEFTGLPEDGASITLSDGIRPPVTFEFDSDGTSKETSVPVPLVEGLTPEFVAQILMGQLLKEQNTAREEEDQGLGIEARLDGARIELITEEPGPQGNIEVRRSGELSAEIEGMEIQGVRKTLAARIQGAVATAFPGGAPAGWTGTDEHLANSTDDLHAIVIADADFLHEQFWSSQVRQGGFLMERRNDNPTIVVNAVENLCGSNDLLSLRSRGVERRPFEKKEELNQEAEERFQAKFDELQTKERDLNKEIAGLSAGASDEGVIHISKEQFDELGDKQQELAETRSELGRVTGDRKREMKALGQHLFLLNILIAPGLVILLGLSYAFTARTRRKSK